MQQYEIVKSVADNQDTILEWIHRLYCPYYFEMDLTYGKGEFYKNIPQPEYPYDLYPKFDYVEKGDSKYINAPKNSMNSIIYDPPFCFGVHGKTLESAQARKYSMYKDFKSLKDDYQETLKECHRALKPNGILVFKCQDYTDSKTTFTHCFVYNWAIEIGFKPIDLFILTNTFKLCNTQIKQRHSRKFHSYFWVFKKSKLKEV